MSKRKIRRQKLYERKKLDFNTPKQTGNGSDSIRLEGRRENTLVGF